jgi:hypothetical protein
MRHNVTTKLDEGCSGRTQIEFLEQREHLNRKLRFCIFRWLYSCLTDKSEVCSPKSPCMLVFFLGKPFLEEDRYGEHTLSL